MDNNRLVDLIDNPFLATLDDFSDIIARIEMYPFCPYYKVLAAKIAYDHNFKEKSRLLEKAALYTPSRQKLKEIIETMPEDLGVDLDSNIEDITSTASISDDNSDLYMEVLNNLKSAQQQKDEFTFKLDSFLPKKNKPNQKRKKIKLSELIEKTKQSEKKSKEEDNKEETFDILSSIHKIDNDDILYENSSENSPEVNDQLDIINSFLDNDVSISRPSLDNLDTSENDLSEDSSQFQDDFISENLAKIYESQGKYAESIDIYEKLSLKFPEKKALFAKHIEELKKKNI
ncbi:hypothetical protein [Aureibacter tunicatorum]|uniref:Tetratricopeptide (TPR) repeat protein n=1 Tax=Aureibacter tunicatorum TaxID=866807 RepID=A0AAE3XNW6_9BACT|nr:hypothetical protein [Aureibacter tunicatorum]MDR6239340.1 tetratricopeptide (TPR) repeat protein [Aureibacter tunicatorum]BDD04737.1 hypothetical protein AUTU_22200 [Aureibacter tunicatorum]